jgi:hypothetical protein
MDEFHARIQRRDAGFWNYFGQERRADAGKQKEYEVGNRGRYRTRTIFKEDEFVHRGANPRTGIVSPFVFDEWNGEDCRSPDMRGKWTESGRADDESWAEDVPQWGMVESALLSSTAQSFDDGSSCEKRSGKTKNSQISSDVNSRPAEMTDEKALKYQAAVRNRCGSVSKTAMRRPILLNSAQWVPASPIPPLVGLQHIRRKKVGSGPIHVGGVSNPETIKVVGQDIRQRISKKDNAACKTNAANSIAPRNTPAIALLDHTSHLNGELADPTASRDNIIEAAASKTEPLGLGQYVPHLRFLQQNPATSLSTSYRRPAHLLAVQQRAIGMKENGRDLFGVLDGGTLSQARRSEQRPQVHRRFGAVSIPTMEFHESEWEDGRQYFLSIGSHGNVSTTNASMRVSRAETNPNHNTYNGWPVPSFGREKVKGHRDRHVSKAELKIQRGKLTVPLVLMSPMHGGAD